MLFSRRTLLKTATRPWSNPCTPGRNLKTHQGVTAAISFTGSQSKRHLKKYLLSSFHQFIILLNCNCLSKTKLYIVVYKHISENSHIQAGVDCMSPLSLSSSKGNSILYLNKCLRDWHFHSHNQ